MELNSVIYLLKGILLHFLVMWKWLEGTSFQTVLGSREREALMHYHSVAACKVQQEGRWPVGPQKQAVLACDQWEAATTSNSFFSNELLLKTALLNFLLSSTKGCPLLFSQLAYCFAIICMLRIAIFLFFPNTLIRSWITLLFNF